VLIAGILFQGKGIFDKGGKVMKSGKFTKVVLLFCIMSLGIISVSLAGKPVTTFTSYPGYVMFRDSSQDKIWSDGVRIYADCSKGGTDMVEICTWDDGTFKYVNFYPGVMQKSFYNCAFGTFSSRSVKFKFNVSGIVGSQATGNAVRDILRWYKAGSERTTSLGYIDDNSLHAPILVYRTGHSQLQFVPDPDPQNANEKAITQGSVNNYYTGDTDIIYWCTRTEPDYEPKPYVIYNFDFGAQEGFEVLTVVNGRTWIVRTKSRRANNPVRLYVIKNDYNGEKVYLTSYASLPFEFAVSLDPFSNNEYPSLSQAPPRIDNISTTWGEIKEEQ